MLTPIFEIMDNNWIPQKKVSLQEALSLIIKNKGINALANPHLCNFLNDFTDYDGTRMYRSIFRGIVSEDILSSIVAGINQQIPQKTILDNAYHVSVNQCGYNETGVKYILDILSKVLFNTLIAEEPKVEPEESKVQPEESQIEYKASNNAVPSFCGIPLGMHVRNFVNDLEKKRGRLNYTSNVDYLDSDVNSRLKKRGYAELECKYPYRQIYNKFSFAGFENTVLSIFYTPYTRTVYKVIIILNRDEKLRAPSLILDKVKSLLKSKFGIPTIDNMPENIYSQKSNSFYLQYKFDNSLVLEYRVLLQSYDHILMYTTSDLLNLAQIEIDKKVDELIQEYEDKKKKELADL